MYTAKITRVLPVLLAKVDNSVDTLGSHINEVRATRASLKVDSISWASMEPDYALETNT